MAGLPSCFGINIAIWPEKSQKNPSNCTVHSHTSDENANIRKMGSLLTSRCARNSFSLSCCMASPLDKISSTLCSIPCTSLNGAMAVIVEQTGAIFLLVCYCEAAMHTQTIHSALHNPPRGPVHQSATLAGIMSIVVKVICSFNHHQFQVLMDDVNKHYGDSLYFCEVRWMSCVAVLSCVCNLQ